MPNCLCCFHCGFCGPEAAEGQVKRNPPGYCIFCGVQNDAAAQRCSKCGRLLPKQPGSSSARAAGPTASERDAPC